MWQFTPFGFFSIVQKPGTDHLTIRSRRPQDLDALRDLYLPELGATIVGGGTDYPFRAACTHEAFAAAQARIARDIDYSNFKGRVGQRQGYARASIYGEVWSVLKKLEKSPAPAGRRSGGKRPSFGGVVIDAQGRVLLRRPKGDYDGAKWTFAKGRPDAGETPEQAALREVREETGYAAEVLATVPGAYDGTTTTNRYWLMRAVEQVQEPHWETQDLAWCTPEQARDRISQSPSRTKRKRDLAVLAAALVTLESL